MAPSPAPKRRPWWKRRVRRAKRRAVNAVLMFSRRRSEADLVAEGPRVATWERRSEWPLTVLAVLFLAGYAIEVLKHPLPPVWHSDIETITWIIWTAFAVDFIVRAVLARRHVRYVWRHVTDLLIIALPILRPLRLLRVVLLVRTLNRRAADSFGGSVIVYGGAVATLICFCASLAVLQAERGHGGNITTFGDAVWWSVVTISTVGYGDKYPSTAEGRFVAAALMLTGVALFGAVTASFASWLVDQARTEEEADQQATRNDLEALHEQLSRMEAQLAAITAATGARPPDAGGADAGGSGSGGSSGPTGPGGRRRPHQAQGQPQGQSAQPEKQPEKRPAGSR